jgi:hypothetical protein
MRVDAATGKLVLLEDRDLGVGLASLATRLDETGMENGLDLQVVHPLGGGRFVVLRVVDEAEANRVVQVSPRKPARVPDVRRILSARIRLLVRVHEDVSDWTLPRARQFLLDEGLTGEEVRQTVATFLKRPDVRVVDGVLKVRRDDR